MLRTLSLGLFASLFVGSLSAVLPASAETCSQGSRTSGECSTVTTEVSSGGVSVSAEVTRPGSPGSVTAAPIPPSRSTPQSASPRRPSAPVLGSAQCRSMVGGKCRASSPPKNPPAAAPRAPVVRTPPTPPSTIRDLAQFQPHGSAFVIEPGSWSLPRVPTNMFSTAAEHTVPGQLLGWPVEVRFTPVSFHWDFGDGSSISRSHGGSSWGDQRFSPTSTTHVYASPGVYRVSLSVEYRAAFRFTGGSFSALSGTVRASAGTQSLEVLRVTPVLVDEGCDVSMLRSGRC